MTTDPYQVLRIADPSTATWDDIYAARRRRLMETHPDRGGDPAEFRQVTEAFETLLVWHTTNNRTTSPAAPVATAQAYQPGAPRRARPSGPRRAAV